MSDGLNFMILDVETTGLPINNNYSHLNIIEIGWVITDKYINIIKQNSFIINGDFEINENIEQLTGISKQKTINDGITITNALNVFYKDIINCQFIIAHNILFDYNMILTEIKNIYNNNNINQNEYDHYINIFKNKIKLCSKYILQKEIDNRYLVISNYKLISYYNYLVGNDNIQTHRSLDDIFMIIECFQSLDEFDILFYFWNKTIQFGKYKYKTNEWICDNDRKYFDWLLFNIYNIDTLLKKQQLFYEDEDYIYDDFIINDNNDIIINDIDINNDITDSDSTYEDILSDITSTTSNSSIESDNDDIFINKRQRLN